MARVLIVGCGCRGRALAGRLIAAGHTVRGTTRDPANVHAIEAIGAEAIVADPDRVGTLRYALDAVTVLCWLMGTAQGEDEAVAALHGPRLAMMLEKTADTTVRGILYEAAGTVDPEVLANGEALVTRARETWEIPVASLHADPADHAAWLDAALRAIDELLGPRENTLKRNWARYAQELG